MPTTQIYKLTWTWSHNNQCCAFFFAKTTITLFKRFGCRSLPGKTWLYHIGSTRRAFPAEEWRGETEAVFPKDRRRMYNGVVIYTLWNIWKERSHRIFEHSSLSPLQVAGRVRESLCFYRSAFCWFRTLTCVCVRDSWMSGSWLACRRPACISDFFPS